MSDNPYLRRRQRLGIGSPGRASEKRIGQALSGKLRPASGALPGAKGDIELSNVLMEAKSTTRASIAINLDWLLKIAAEARAEGRSPALTVSFVRPDGAPRLDGAWVMVPMHVWQEKLR
ncbi:hypothetical protein V3589_11260 [Sinorhizobium fredii]|uniref:hypothetical protein n=1 Tax=Rhizobium fredii TaxID=380 RepID=UPI00309CAA19